jgi:phosphoglycerate dehydrogenase-like enzyme
MKLVIYPAVDAERLEKIVEAAGVMAVVNVRDEASAIREIGDADALFGKLSPPMLAAARKLRWVQSPTASLEHYIFPELVEHPCELTNMRGLFSDVIADHVFGYVLCFARKLHLYIRQQINARWEPLGGEEARSTFSGGLVFGMRVLAVDPVRTDAPEGIAALWNLDRLPELLAACDFVVIAAPHTPTTVKMFRRPQFQQMKPTAYLINIGRGVIVDLDDLVEALNAKEIAGTALDVFESEPLSADHPLWGMSNVIITPHVAAASVHIAERHLGVLLDNVRHFVSGEPLKNLVDKHNWF